MEDWPPRPGDPARRPRRPTPPGGEPRRRGADTPGRGQPRDLPGGTPRTRRPDRAVPPPDPPRRSRDPRVDSPSRRDPQPPSEPRRRARADETGPRETRSVRRDDEGWATKAHRRRAAAPPPKDPKDRTPKDRTPKDRTPKDRAPKDRAPKDRAPKDRAPKDRAPKERAPRSRPAQPRTAQPKTTRSRPAKGSAAAAALTRRRAMRPFKLILAIASVLVLIITGYSWATYNDLQNGLTTDDVTSGFDAPDGATDVLLIGNDSRLDAQGNPLPKDVLQRLRAGPEDGELTDTMILVRIPNDGSRAVGVSFPRDLFVDIPDDYGQHKLNSAFSRAKNVTAEELTEEGAGPDQVRRESVQAGRRLLVKTIEELSGIGIDHYAEVNLLGFALFTDAVGGVQVCLNEPVNEEFSGARFTAGVQTISGPDALAFVRQRHELPRGDLDRVVRQQVFLAGLADRILSAGTLTNPGKIKDLIEATKTSLVLDDDFDILDFARRMRKVASGNVEFQTVPILGESDSSEDGSVLEVDERDVRRFIANLIKKKPEPGKPIGDPAVAVDVFNSSGIVGLAGRVSGVLGGQNFTAGTVANGAPLTTSIVRYGAARKDVAEDIGDYLGDLKVSRDPGLPENAVAVYLGEDYGGPGLEEPAAEPVVNLQQGQPTGGDGEPAPPPAKINAGKVPCVN